MSTAQHRKAVIGSKSNFWLYSTRTGFDLTHPATPESPLVYPRVTFDTETDSITIDPAKSALVIIDMQNFFLSPALGRPRESNGWNACHRLLENAIPAARKAGIRIIWLNWGLNDDEIEAMAPAILKTFGFHSTPEDDPSGPSELVLTNAKGAKKSAIYCGLGNELGAVTLDDGSTVQAGRMLVRDQWNTALVPSLDKAWHEGRIGGGGAAQPGREDVWVHKNRMSGLWGSETAMTDVCDKLSIRTLLFAGVNTDQCVSGSLTDAFSKAYDCILLKDCAGTSSPDFAQDCIEYNGSKTYGFVLDSARFRDGVDNALYTHPLTSKE